MHDDQFTATGPNNPASGAGFEASAFSTANADKGFQWGLRALARRCGVMGQASGSAIAGVCGDGHFAKFGVFGVAFRDHIGVVGASVENNRDLFNLNVAPGNFDLDSLGVGPGTGVLGKSGSGLGVHGISESATGVFGVSDTGIGAHGTSDTGTGVFGASRSGFAVHGASEDGPGGVFRSETKSGVFSTSGSGFGVHGTSESAPGGVFESETGPGVVATSVAGRAGVFECRGGGLAAQVGLVPQPMSVPNSVPAAPMRFDAAVLQSLPAEGRGGDLLATEGQDGRCTLWFCTQARDGDRPAVWSQVLLATPAASQEFAFADWTTVTGNVASGTLSGASIFLRGTTVSEPPASVTDGTATVFNRPAFTPPLPTSDAIHFVGSTGNSYTLEFGSEVKNPVLHFGSLASTLHFPLGTPIRQLSGDDQFSVSGSDVVGQFEAPTDDGNGTVRLSGTFTSITFSTTFAGTDGIFLQVGVSSST